MNESQRLRIVSSGDAQGTFIYDAKGNLLPLGRLAGITKIVIDPILPNQPVTAHITIQGIGLDINVDIERFKTELEERE